MSTSISSEVIIGVQINNNCLWRNEKRAGCSHASKYSNAKFCPECGKESWVQAKYPIDAFNEDDRLGIYTVLNAYPESNEATFVGVFVHKISAWSDPKIHKRIDISVVDKIFAELKEYLTSISLWTDEVEQSFGVWNILSIS